jgi:hypothetical protein
MVEPVANVTEKHRMPMVASTGATTSIFKKGRRFIFMMRRHGASGKAGSTREPGGDAH